MRHLTLDLIFLSREGRIRELGEGMAPDRPARPSRPELVSPKCMPSMESSRLPKAVFMLHNLAHIELNAVDLAWDTLVKPFHAHSAPIQISALGPLFTFTIGQDIL